MAHRTLVVNLLVVALAVLAAVGLIGQCQAKHSYRDQWVFSYTYGNKNITLVELNTILNGAKNYSSKEVADVLHRSMNRSEVLQFGDFYTTPQELTDLNFYSTNASHCNMNEFERRETICKRVESSAVLKNYCQACVEGMRKFCRNYPYYRIVLESISRIDFVKHNDAVKFWSDLAVGGYYPSGATIASYLANKDDSYRKELRRQCKSFEEELRDNVHHFEQSPDKTMEFMGEFGLTFYYVWRNCKSFLGMYSA